MIKQKNNIDLANDSIPKLFFTYFIPMLLSMLAMVSYVTADGIFVNKKLGDDAMKAIAIVWPIFPATMACSLMFAIGGASLVSYYLAKEKAHIARIIFSSICYILFPLSLIIGILGYINAELVINFFIKDASINIHKMATEYLQGICVGLFGIILHPVLDYCVINDKRPKFAMFAMLVGANLNLVFNYLFLYVLEFGIIGSAFATTLAHIIGSLILFWHYVETKYRILLLSFFNKNLAYKIQNKLSYILNKQGDLYFVLNFKISFIAKAIKVGSPYAASEISVGIVMWLYNQILKDIGGEDALAIYSCLLYSGFNFFTILLALSESIQPIASFNYGIHNFIRLKKILHFYIYVTIFSSIAIYMLFFVFNDFIVSLYLKDINLKTQSIKALNIYFIGFVFLGLSILIALYLQALQRALASMIVTLSYTIIFIIILLPLLTKYYSLKGAWIAYPLSQLCALFVSFIVLYITIKNGLYEKSKK